MLLAYLKYIVPSSVLIPLIVAIYRYDKLNIGYRFLLGFLILSAYSSVIGRIFALVYHNNLVVNQCYTVGEYLLLAGFYYHQFNSSLLKKIIAVVSLFFTVFSVTLIIKYIHVIRHDDYGVSIESLLMILLGIALISRNISLPSTLENWEQYPVNWFNTGILLYFSGSMFIFLLANYNVDGSSLIYMVTRVCHGTFFIILTILFTIGFYKI